ncbi:MAG: hypothetical protein FWD35_04040 [Oscillospiraceae bacterium]|nr:hypothetical protein [Oscillospiraceae bacterium]
MNTKIQEVVVGDMIDDNTLHAVGETAGETAPEITEDAENSLDSVIEGAVERAFVRALDTLMAKVIESVTEMLAIGQAVSEDPLRDVFGAVPGDTGREKFDNRVDFSKLSYGELCDFLAKNPNSKFV